MQSYLLVINGVYVHFKGWKYRVLGVANSTVDRENLVIYKEMTGNKQYARPVGDFFGLVDREDYTGPRFRIDAFHDQRPTDGEEMFTCVTEREP